jgi:hypothetical protein
MHVWLSQKDPILLESIVEELPDEVNLETIADEEKTWTTAPFHQGGGGKPQLLRLMHIKEREQRKGSDDVLKAQKAVAYQLKSYCIGKTIWMTSLRGMVPLNPWSSLSWFRG